MKLPRARVLSLLVGGIAMCFALACSSEQRVLGERCPTPYLPESGATLAPDAGLSDIYGTSCAPCDSDDIRLDDQGCPIYVTFETCGGDICIGEARITRTPDVTDEDGGTDEDAGGAGEEDAGD